MITPALPCTRVEFQIRLAGSVEISPHQTPNLSGPAVSGQRRVRIVEQAQRTRIVVACSSSAKTSCLIPDAADSVLAPLRSPLSFRTLGARGIGSG